MPESGTLIVSALLLLAIAFSGYWIVTYVTPGSDPWSILPYFGLAAGAIIILGLAAVVIMGRRGSGRR